MRVVVVRVQAQRLALFDHRPVQVPLFQKRQTEVSVRVVVVRVQAQCLALFQPIDGIHHEVAVALKI